MSTLLSAELRRSLPPLYASEGKAEAVVQAKFFTPWSNWTWYVIEFDGKDTFFGLIDGFELELGYFNLSVLEMIRGPGGLKIERDEHFIPTPLKRLKDTIVAQEVHAPPRENRQR